jgi:hypothetical protein
VALLDGVSQSLTLLVQLFANAVQLHHFEEFTYVSVFPSLKEGELTNEVRVIAKQIHACGISGLEVSLDDDHGAVGQAERLLNLMKKFYSPQKDEFSVDL